MKLFIKVATVLETTDSERMGMSSELIPTETKIDPNEICAYTQCIPNEEDKDAIIIYLKSGHQFYSPISMKQLERLLQEVL